MSDTPSPLLWHYTSFDGLHGIVTKGELFASSLAYLNDTEEFLYTINRLLSLLESEQKRGIPLNDLVKGLIYENVPEMVKEVFAGFRGQQIYVSCFSTERDDLSQWRSYTPRPPGFAIGFQRDRLESLAASFGFEMRHCLYPTADELLATVKSAYDDATLGMQEEKKKLPMPATRDEPEKFIEKWALRIVQAMIVPATRNKHPKFAAEKEVRLVGHNVQFEVNYRLSGTWVVPYIKIPARLKEGPSPIKEILVGPCPHQNAVIEATRQMCLQHDIRPKVSTSAIPFRNW